MTITGYAGDDAATAAALDSEGWLKTGDLCYFNSDGFLFIIDRLKELIKYKGYQVIYAYKSFRGRICINDGVISFTVWACFLT